MGNLNLSLTEEQLNKIFPYHIVIGKDMCVRSFGAGIGSSLQSLSAGTPFDESFTLKNTGDVSGASLQHSVDKSIMLESKNGNLMLQGELLELPEGFLFAGSLISGSATPSPNEGNQEPLPELKLPSSRRSTNKEGVVFLYPNGKIFWVNDAYLELTGYSREDLFSKNPQEVAKSSIDPEDMEKVMSQFRKGEPFDVVLKRRRKDGTYFWTKTKGQPIFNEEGVITQYLTTVEDLTPEREKDEKLSLLSMIAEKNINPVLVCDNLGRIEWVSSNFIKTTGYTRAEAIGQRPGELLEGPETDPETSLYIKSRASKGMPVSTEVLNYTKDGQKRWIRLHGQALHNDEGEVLKYYSIREDVTERKMMEVQREELLKVLAKSNTELEDYAQIVSHDLKSPLNSIHSLISWIKEDNKGAFDESTNKYFSMIEDKLEKMHDLIQGILTYSKIDKIDITKETIDINDVVKDIIGMIHIPENIKVEVKNQLPVMRADKFRIQQLFQNLIANAVTYNDKPVGVIEVGSEEHDSYHIFSIRDNGQGIAKEHQEKIFKKFSSFSDNEKSSGLGLSIVKKIVDNYKGEIWLESEPGIGSAFFVKLSK